MQLSRRHFAAGGGLSAALASFSCGGGGSSSKPSRSTKQSHERLLLDRGAFGPRPGEVDALKVMGADVWVEEQLAPESIDDRATDALVATIGSYGMPIEELVEQNHLELQLDLGKETMLRALFSRRQLHEVMVEFWSDHFHMCLGKLPFLTPLRIVAEREVLREHAMGKVRDLVHGMARSPAMLVFLDNVVSRRASPNENYARELMELHTMGVDAGYTQDDVEDLARALTGWGITDSSGPIGQFYFDSEQHDDLPKDVFGLHLKGAEGEDEVRRLIDHFLAGPQAAEFFSTKLVRRFVADEPPRSLVDELVSIYLGTDGDIRAMLRTILMSREFAEAPLKFKRPFRFVVSSLRALDVDPVVAEPALRAVSDMGQALFHWPEPDGYADTSDPWKAGLLARWNYCLELASGEFADVDESVTRLVGGVEGADRLVDDLGRHFVGRPLGEDSRAAMVGHVGVDSDLHESSTRARVREVIAMMLAHPEFQWA